MITGDKQIQWKRIISVLIIIICLITWAVFTFDYKTTFDNKAESLWVNVPSNAPAGETFRGTVMALDWGGRVSSSYTNTVTFSLLSYCPETHELIDPDRGQASLPDRVKMTGAAINTGVFPNTWLSGKDYGRKSLNISIGTPGIHYILAGDDRGLTALSNPVYVTEEKPERMLVWGDLHSHSIYSDGSGLPGYLLTYARDYALLDYVSITDHGEMTLSSMPRPRWIINRVARATDEYNREDDFVALHGVEWTTNYGFQGRRGYGHYAVVTDGGTPLEIARTIQENPGELWDYLDTYCRDNNARAVAIPHHLTRTAFEMDWAGANPEYVRTAEVFSVHGDFLLQPDDPRNKLGAIEINHEPSPGAGAACGLKMGHRFALVANTDSHDGNPGRSLSHAASHYPIQWPWQATGVRAGHTYRGGITGSWVTALTREGVIEASRSGNVIGTTAPFRPVVNFEINGVSPGTNDNTVYVPHYFAGRDISVTVARDGLETKNAEWPELTVEIWKNSELWQTAGIDTAVGKVEFRDDTIITGTSYTDILKDREGNYYLHERAILTVNPEELNTGGADYYFVRLHGGNEFWAWFGPLWVEIEPR